jgi:FkbM family methyltransferase
MRYRERLLAANLQAGDVAIDCGANVGEVTARLAATGATVYAFEPNPHAFLRLAKRFRSHPKVHCLEKAVLDRGGKIPLFLHTNAAADQIKWSAGSSTLAFKSNVNPKNFVEVEAVDLAEFVLQLERPVRLIKLDVEGVECRIINRLLDSGAINRVGLLLVETHERKIPELREEMSVLRARISAEKRTNIHLDWI